METYEKILSEIFVRFPSVQEKGFGSAYKPGLENMQRFLDVLGNPHKGLKTVHVAGTNGKGSVANMLAASFTASGYKTGLYTSPHILDFRERMRIADEDSCSLVPKDYVYDFLIKYRPEFDRLSLSFFEITTGMAFKWFADENVGVAVIETGLGGRLDSTNVVVPELSIVTSIGLDHCDLLGSTRAAIAGEKAGIFKPDVPAVVGVCDEETAPVFRTAASALDCPLTFADTVIPEAFSMEAEMLEAMDLKGEYQKENLHTVLVARDILSERFRLPLSDVSRGIVHTASVMDFHGRWERLCDNPLVICDIGHNAHALRHNFSQLEAMLADGRATSLVMIYGVMADKNLDDILPLMPRGASWFFVTASTPRALAGEKIFEKFEAYRQANGIEKADGTFALPAPSVSDALTKAMECVSDVSVYGPRPLVYIGGSTFVVSDAVKAMTQGRV